MDSATRFELIKKDTAEITTEDELKTLLRNKKSPVSYWGVAPTGPPHIGYYRAISKQMDLIEAGFKHKILIANIHAYLDDMKAPWEEIKARGEIYKKCFELLGLKGNNVEYVLGSDFQAKPDYQMKLYQSLPLVTVERATRAASEVCRMTNPKVSSLVYPLMQSLDCWGLEVDIAYGGIDQRHVYMLTRDLLPKLGLKAPSLIFTPLGMGLSGKGKMSASQKASRLELFAKPEDIHDKINSAFCPEGVIDENPVLEYAKYLTFPRISKFQISRPQKFGGDITVNSYEALAELFAKKGVHPMDLKNAVATYLVDILKPVRDYFTRNSDLLKIYKKEL
ncbi:MAG: tyrosine--tRNA ligase [archaeon]